jgi:YhcN/YlaJ family sporulation lipoprotein
MKKRNYLFSILAFVLVVMLLVSCAPARRPGYNLPSPTPGTRQTRFVPRTAPNRPPMPTTAPGPLTQQRRYNPNRTGNQMGTTTTTGTHSRAQKIAAEAAKQKDVRSASCVITGNTALVGLKLDKQPKGKLTDAIKREVEKKVKATDTKISNVVVTADPDMVSRIDTMFKDIGKGKPISGFATEIKEMINRIKPKTTTK